ncbi:MAG TPA: tetratricopeptide repeat protein [Vicinamibacterales bacterium]|nr:tetratricopeptide repeat protein [Vicinamibacterales bacterium]
MRLRFAAIGSLMLVAVWPGRVPAMPQAPAAARVLVMPFTVLVDAKAAGGAGASLWLGEAARLLLLDDFERLGVTTVTRDESNAAFDRLQLPVSAALTRATMIRVGELVGASEIVFGDMRLSDQLTVRARMLKLGTSSAAPEVSRAGALTDIMPLFERTAMELATATGRRSATPAKTEPPMAFPVFESYVKGLVSPTPTAQQRFFESALKQAPHDPRLLLALWGVYAAQGQNEKALSVASGVSKDSPLSRRARFLAALSLIELSRFDGAAEQLGALNRERPSPVLSNALGIVQLRRPNGASSAAPFFNRAVDAEPSNTDYLFNLGYAHALAQDAAGALSWLREAVRFDAANGDAHLVMSAVLMSTSKNVEAQRELDLAKQLGTRPDTSTLAVTTRIPPGLERLRTDLDVAPADRVDANIANPAQRDQRETAAFHLDQGRALFNTQRDREATSELRRAIYLAPYEDLPHMLLGKIYVRGGRLTEAIDEFKVAIWCRETAEARVALAGALLESGDKDAAKREAERALVLDPLSAEAKAILKKIGANIPPSP